MIRYCKKLFLFLLLFSMTYLLLMYMVDRGLKKSRFLDFQQWNEIFEGRIQADILVLGSSRAWRQVDPAVVDSITGHNSYNLGMDGYHLPMQMKRYEIYSRHNNKPRYIIQILDHFSISRRSDLFNREQFLPYIGDDILAEELQKYKGFNWADYQIPYYCYIGSGEIALAGLLEYLGLKKYASTRYKGYEANEKMWEPDFDKERVENPDGKRAAISRSVYQSYDKFLEKAKQDSIHVILVYAPEYKPFQNYIINRDTVSYLYQQLSQKHGIPYIDFKNHIVCEDKSYFYNPTHLNKKGAELFSLDLSFKLDSIISLHEKYE